MKYVLRNVISLLLLVILMLFPLISVCLADETTVADEEALVALLNEYRNAKADRVEFKATKDYYKELSKDGFGRVQAIGLRCGMSRSSIRGISYSDSSRLIRISGVEWVEPHCAECGTLEEAQEAIARFISEKVSSFEVICEKNIASKAQDELDNYLAQSGIKKASVTYYRNTYPQIFFLDNPEPYDVPYCVASTEEEYRNALEYMWQQKAEEFYIVMKPALFKSLKRTNLDLIERASQMDRYHTAKDTTAMAYRYTYVSYSDEPRLICETEDDIREAIRMMGTSGTKDFRLILEKSLYDTVSAQKMAKLKTLIKEAGMTEYGLQYSDAGTLLFSNAEIQSDAVMLSSIADAVQYMDTCAAEERGDITLFCTSFLYGNLIGNIQPFALEEDVTAPIYDLIAHAGISEYSFSYSKASGIIQIKDIAWYPGLRILHALKNGSTAALTSEETETMEKANQVAEACRCGNPLETARGIHDWLCNHVAYTIDETTTRDDNAIGAILDGKANCDGYADAFYLIGGLAGLEVRYQHGDSYKTGFGAFLKKETHMWNLLKIDGSWRLVDVTWDDQEDYITYAWFNLGQDRAERMHIWNREMSVPLAPETDMSVRPENEYLVYNANDVQSAVSDALDKGLPVFEIICADSGVGREKIENALKNQVRTSCRYSWNELMLVMTVLIP